MLCWRHKIISTIITHLKPQNIYIYKVSVYYNKIYKLKFNVVSFVFVKFVCDIDLSNEMVQKSTINTRVTIRLVINSTSFIKQPNCNFPWPWTIKHWHSSTCFFCFFYRILIKLVNFVNKFSSNHNLKRLHQCFNNKTKYDIIDFIVTNKKFKWNTFICSISTQSKMHLANKTN